jgi:hypothetical protein
MGKAPRVLGRAARMLARSCDSAVGEGGRDGNVRVGKTGEAGPVPEWGGWELRVF